jgi:iron complex outermembrane receptor protein
MPKGMAAVVPSLACTLGLALLLGMPDLLQAQDVTIRQLPTIEVIGVTPAQGAQLPLNLTPYSVQGVDADELAKSQTLGLTDYMNRHLAGVTINAAQGNPLQPDLQFRGFTATPLLGGSEGIAVYVDGVRVNEVFGDTTNWDLIPQQGISRMSLLSGANPVFGLNTLGGAIDITSKNGFTDTGSQAQFLTGSYGRNATTAQSGGNNGSWGYYLLANHFEEHGWRDLSGSNAKNFLGTLSWRGDKGSFDLHLAHAETDLTGNGTAPIQELALRPQSVFTAPDLTRNFMTGITGQATYNFSDDTLLSATLFGRQVNARAYNGDISNFHACADDANHLCNDDGSSVLDQHGNRLSSDYDAINNIGVRKQRSHGGSLQLVFRQPLWGLENQFVAGLDVDHGRLNYSSVLEAAMLQPDPHAPYSTVTSADSGVYVPDHALSLHVSDINAGVYFTDTLSLSAQWALTASGRYNHTHTVIQDTSGLNPDLDGNHGFHRFNPGLGTTYQWSPAINFYAGYSESTRAPTPVELTCASPSAPCLLPNDFVSDPDLKQVVAKSWEIGLRGKLGSRGSAGSMHWDVGLFRTTNVNDIQFQATGGAQSNQGFYANVGDTRRQGLQALLSGKWLDNRLDWFASYTWLAATFRTPFDEVSANNPHADPGTGLIRVRRGDRIPGLPKQVFKLGADYALRQR